MRPTIPSPEHQVEFPTGVKFPKRYLRNSLHDNSEITKKLSFFGSIEYRIQKFSKRDSKKFQK